MSNLHVGGLHSAYASAIHRVLPLTSNTKKYLGLSEVAYL